jgi:hypothetical protein
MTLQMRKHSNVWAEVGKGVFLIQSRTIFLNEKNLS